MGYVICKIQNVSSFSDKIPTITICENDPGWEIALTNWLNGKNPTDSPEWKRVFLPKQNLLLHFFLDISY